MTTSLPTHWLTPRPPEVDADLVSAHTLLGCLVREVSEPDRQVVSDGAHLLVRLPYTDRRVRVGLRRASLVGTHRFAGPAELEFPEGPDGELGWAEIGLDRLVDLVSAELTERTGQANDEFAQQVTASRDALADILVARPSADADRAELSGPTAAYVASEQALIGGHPRHPAPKWRSGDPRQWRRYSPETRAAFPLTWLAVPDELVVDHAVDGDFDVHAATSELLADGGEDLPDGHRAVPVHPWQMRLLADDAELGPVLAAALADGALRHLGTVGARFHATASVRTLYQPDADLFIKTSLNVRITNCLRKNASYELIGAVELNDALADPLHAVAARHPGFTFLPEPAARSVALPETYGTAAHRHALLESLGSIVRAGVSGEVGPDETLHLAGALCAVYADPTGGAHRVIDLAGEAASPQWAATWWERYTALLVPPVLRLWSEHGVALEPHLQNVLVVLDGDHMPVRVIVRDLEGAKLAGPRNDATLARLSDDVAAAASYDEERAWNRVAYCLFVNHLDEIAAALTDVAQRSSPDLTPMAFEADLWSGLRDLVATTADDLGGPSRLRALLAGVPLPAKANLLTRWERSADRHARYVPFPNPLDRDRP